MQSCFGVVSVEIATFLFFTYLRVLLTLLTCKKHRERDKLASSQLTAVTAVHWKHCSQRSGKSNNKFSVRKN